MMYCDDSLRYLLTTADVSIWAHHAPRAGVNITLPQTDMYRQPTAQTERIVYTNSPDNVQREIECLLNTVASPLACVTVIDHSAGCILPHFATNSSGRLGELVMFLTTTRGMYVKEQSCDNQAVAAVSKQPLVIEG